MKAFLTVLTLLFSLNAHAMLFANKKVLDNASMGATVASNGVDVGKYGLISFQAVWTGGGTPMGTFTLEVSNDDVAVGTGGNESSNVVNWTTYSNSAIAITTDGDLGYNPSDLGYRWARVKYTRTSGTGTLNIQAILKKEEYR